MGVFKCPSCMTGCMTGCVAMVVVRFATSESSAEKQKHEEVDEGWMVVSTTDVVFRKV